MHSTSDSNSGFTAQIRHTSRGWSEREYNLITEAMAAAMTPTPTTMMMPSTSVVSPPQPTGGNINNIIPDSINLITSSN